MDNVVAELRISGVFPKEVLERVTNCIKANIELVMPCESLFVEGLDVEIRLVG